MKLFMIIYAGARIGGVVGPLPYDEVQCLARASDSQHIIDAQIATGHDIKGAPLTDLAKSLRFKCEWHDNRPETEAP